MDIVEDNKVLYVLRETLLNFQPIVVSKDTSGILSIVSTFKNDIPVGMNVQVNDLDRDLISLGKAKELLSLHVGRLLNYLENVEVNH